MNILETYGLSERFINEASLYPDYEIARVIAQYKGMYKIVRKDCECYAEVSGKFRYESDMLSTFPAVGDFVMISSSENQERALIHHVLTRRSVFERTAVGVTGQSQIIASNIDIVFICMSLNNNFNLSRLERYTSIAWNSGATPVIVLTKSDLCEDTSSLIAQVEASAPFTDIIVTSAFDDEACKRLLSYIKPKITASFIGSSGVGKSTLINKLMGEDVLETSSIGRDDKGRHTTTGREMLILPNGGIVIDTPGMRELGAQSVDLSTTFSDIEELEKSCRFRDCTHTSEPGCAVLEAIASGTLEQRRLDNYFKIKREAKYVGLTSRELENAKLNEMFKEVGGMKNAKKFIRHNSKSK